MGFVSKLLRSLRTHITGEKNQDAITVANRVGGTDAVDHGGITTIDSELQADDGVATIDATQAVWGSTGLQLLVFGLAVMLVVNDLDGATVNIYANYSISSFGQLSTLGTLGTATTILYALIKPPIAKLSDVIGRGQTLLIMLAFYLVAYVLMTTARSFAQYAVGTVFYTIGSAGPGLLATIIISDVTSPRWRGFAIGLSYFPAIITPWMSAIIVESVMGTDGIGWRWGIGMFAFLMPFGLSLIISCLLFYQRKARKLGLLQPRSLTLHKFSSEIDLGGTALFVTGFACLLLPLTLAAQLPDSWRTPWIPALLCIGAVALACFPLYEKHVAAHPVVPVAYFGNVSVVLSCVLIALDSVASSATHTYLYAWATVSHDMSAQTSTFLVYVNGVVQCLVGILTGWIMLYTRRYKWLTMAGTVIRLIGYGVMLRLRGDNNTIAEVFGQQMIQGLGSGIVATTLTVAPQIVVPRAELAQVIAINFCSNFIGSSIGSTVAGAIYTGTMRESLRKWLNAVGDNSTGNTDQLVDSLYNSITGTLPAWGSLDRLAINRAYTEVIIYITYAAIGASAPCILLTLFLPDLKLKE